MGEVKRFPQRLDETAETLVDWLRKQAAPGLDEFFGRSPERQYVREVIEAHASHPACETLNELALAYLTYKSGSVDSFDSGWLTPYWRDKLPPSSHL